MVSCEGCATTLEGPPVTWTRSVSELGDRWLCECCTRTNLRSIEGRLDQVWW